ncbi:family 20 glycosylhydrolase [Pseudonocardia sp. MH-G8]|uniref:family 20 glycosylhydrolase n=1 Tax=Pseudonocardia sp. MH-G8 TaxID=1854588 RepID=UPI000BA14D63|nr:family 20 glycosylhydrolase [Pseudonocardia sp. MH-G8]OZM79195.1 glycoside hydrolase [Pseudonocardia sp. MH-G8]
MTAVPLFPVPRSLEWLDAPGPAPRAPLAVQHDPDLPEQGYSLERDASGTRIGYRDEAGLRYARQTLDQLTADRELAGRAVRVRDWPDFAVRGFMLDVSRDRVPTRRTLRRYVEILADARMNQLELYTEHTFAFAGQEAVWAAASPLTADDMRWLDALCAAHGITLVANQNTLGHMERWLATGPHRDRAEKPEGFSINGRHRPPSTLEPTAENAEFAVALVRELAATVRARRVNIGADEPWELGRGRSAADAAERGVGRVYLDQLLRIATPLLEDGVEVEFWADVLADHPQVAQDLPTSGLIPVVWQYDGPEHARAALDRASEEQHRQWKIDGFDMEALAGGFRKRAEALTAAGRPFWVAPGTGAWKSLVGRLDNAVENVLDAAEAGLEHGATGYVLTSWGDHGHHEPPAITYPPLLLAAAASWCLDANREIDLAAALDRVVFAEDAGLGAVLTAIGSVAAALDAPILNSSALFTLLLEGGDAAAVPAVTPAALADAERVLADAARTLASARTAGADGDIAVRETAQAVELARFAVALLAAGGTAALTPDAAADLITRLDALLVEQRACWLLSARPGGLDDSLSRFAPLRAVLAGCAARA